MQIKFEIVGMGNRCWSSSFERIDYLDLLQDIGKNTEIQERNLDLAYNEVDNQGLIYCNERVTGKFLVNGQHTTL